MYALQYKLFDQIKIQRLIQESPGRPMVQLSSRTEPQDENSVTDEINITWAVPKDDGGFPITGYRIEMLDIQTNNWIEITFIEVTTRLQNFN